jgi:hypothetical protein
VICVREDESARDFAQRKVTHENAQMRERKSTQLQFIQSQISVMVANEAFEMDIDRQHIFQETHAPRCLIGDTQDTRPTTHFRSSD